MELAEGIRVAMTLRFAKASSPSLKRCMKANNSSMTATAVHGVDQASLFSDAQGSSVGHLRVH